MNTVTKAKGNPWVKWGGRILSFPLVLWGMVALGGQMQAWSNDIAGLTHPDYRDTPVTVSRTWATAGGLLGSGRHYVTVRDQTGQASTFSVLPEVYGQVEAGAPACVRTNRSARFPSLQDELLPGACPRGTGGRT